MSIKALGALDDATKILRSEIIAISGVSDELVLNALTSYGADLNRILDEVAQGLEHSHSNPEDPRDDLLILFENRSDDSSSDNVFHAGVTYQAYKMHIIIYGDGAEEMAVRIKNGLLLLDEKAKLDHEGVHIASVSNIESMNEFKNETMWQRRDFDISFAFRRDL